ncbi:hypothetical protein M0R45_021633 [Rubus argutus]|uniref:Uncharacterized protein n=1 Tax=Rubus argutus TaxID=59490 RepID=A0AAW1XD86_RUBAR
MVDKCRGLPLAVVVLGGLLSGKDPEQWEMLSRNSRWSIMNDVDRVSTILALSYNYLPFHLKLCFQHLGIFPEDFCIPKNELIRLWVAERFLPQQGEDTEEGVAEKCIYELINRSMVLVAMRTSRGRVKAIRIHDVLRDFSISKAKESRFLEIYSGKEVVSTTSRSFEARRLAIHGKQDYKVLDNLTQLRYLGFSGSTQMVEMPSIGRLTNLQTLDLRHCVISHEIPDVLWKMKRLRHLLFNTRKPCGDLRFDTLIHLQTLKSVTGEGRWIRDGLLKMIYMRRLRLQWVRRESVNWITNLLANLRHLQSLTIEMFSGSFPQLEHLSGCVNLQKLHLDGRIEKLPGVQEFPPNLVKLVLTRSNLQQDSIATLEKLPKLKMLALNFGSYWSSELVFSSEGFPQLEVLHLKSLWDLKEWTVEEGAMMNLKHLMVHACEKLNQVSEGFNSLIALEELDISRSPDFEHVLRTNQHIVDFMDKHSIKFVRR